MRTVSRPPFPTAEAAIAWMDAPERVISAWRNEELLTTIDELLIPHGLEIVISVFQGDPYVTVERRVQ